MKLIFLCFILLSLLFGVAGHVQAGLGDPCDETSDCTVGGATYICKSSTDILSTPSIDGGKCSGPCTKASEAVAGTKCQDKVGSALGWSASICTAVDDASQKPGVCVELPPGTKQLSKGPQSGTALLALVDVITNWIFAIFVVLTIIFVLLAAFQFVTAGGQAEKVGEARQKLIWAAVGIIIALLSKGLVPIIRSIVGG